MKGFIRFKVKEFAFVADELEAERIKPSGVFIKLDHERGKLRFIIRTDVIAALEAVEDVAEMRQ